MSKKKIILFSLFVLLAIFVITVFFLILQHKYEKRAVEQVKFEIKILQGNDNFAPTGIASLNIKKINIINVIGDKKELEITLDDEGSKIFADITAKNNGKQIGVFLDDVPISMPTIQEAITGGKMIISGNLTNNEALNLKTRLLGYYYPNSKEYKNFQFSESPQKINETSEPIDKSEVKAIHLLICYNGVLGCDNSTLTKEDALKKIEALKLKATPENFTELVAVNSMELGAKETKGELGWFGIGIMVKPFEDAIFNAKVGEIIGPVETEFGFHLIYKTNERE